MDGQNLGLTAIIAAALVPVVSLTKQAHFPAKVNFIIAVVASVIAAAIGTFAEGGHITAAEAVSRLGTAFIAGQSVYQLYFRGTTVDTKLTQVGGE